MLLVVAYDVNTETPQGKRRLRRVAAVCLAYGQRVQKSVFECVISEKELVKLRARLLKEMDASRDSVRIYFIGEAEREKMEAYGQSRLWDFEGPLVI